MFIYHDCFTYTKIVIHGTGVPYWITNLVSMIWKKGVQCIKDLHYTNKNHICSLFSKCIYVWLHVLSSYDYLGFILTHRFKNVGDPNGVSEVANEKKITSNNVVWLLLD